MSRHGVTTWYVRRGHGKRVRIKAAYDSREFSAEYRAALEGKPPPSKSPETSTLAWGLQRYRESSAWAALSNATRRQSENLYKSVLKTVGNEVLRDITNETILAGRERQAASRHTTRGGQFSQGDAGCFFKWGADPKGGNLVKVNPTIGVKLLKGKNDKEGFHTWTNEENHPIRESMADWLPRAPRA